MTLVKVSLAKGAMLVAGSWRWRAPPAQSSRSAQVTDEKELPLFNAGRLLFSPELKTQWPSGALQLSRTAGRQARGLHHHHHHDGESVGLVCLSVHYKDSGMFMANDVKAHAPLQHQYADAKRACRSLMISY
jgi:hypothetical protein